MFLKNIFTVKEEIELKNKKIKETIKRMCEPGNEEWNHQYVFPNNIKTRKDDVNSPGYNINKWERLKPIFEEIKVENKTFLDVGCSDGYYSIELAKLGAKHVLGSDLDELRIKRANFAKEMLDIDNVDFERLDLYKIPKNKFYDVTIGLGLLHRIPDMLTCLEKMSEISNTIVVEFKTYKSADDTFLDHGGKSKSNSLNGLYKTPTISYVCNRLRALGHKNIKIYEDSDSHLNYPRTIIVGSKNEQSF